MSRDGRYCCGGVEGTRGTAGALWDGSRLIRINSNNGSGTLVASAVNRLGNATLYEQTSANADRSIGYMWIAPKLTALSVPDQQRYSWPRAISGGGTIIVGGLLSGGSNWACKWADGRIQKLAPSGKFNPEYSDALGISDDGRIVVGHVGNLRGHFAAMWAGSTPPRVLEGPAGVKVSECYAWATNLSGSVVVGHVWDGFRRVPARWANTGKLQVLSGMPERHKDGFARGVDDKGGTIVGFFDYGKNRTGFVWESSKGLVSANAYLGLKGLSKELSGLRITAVMGISANGKVFSGTCVDRQGRTHGWKASL